LRVYIYDQARRTVGHCAGRIKPGRHSGNANVAKAHLDTDELATIAIAAMVKNFNTDELNAMANFYGSPEGKSILAKYPAYIAEVMPAMFAEIQREIGEMQIEMQNSRHTRKSGT
jgi:hypothetical protein